MKMLIHNSKIQVIKYIGLILVSAYINGIAVYILYQLTISISGWFLLALILFIFTFNALILALAGSNKIFGCSKLHRIYIRQIYDSRTVVAVYCVYLTLFKVTAYVSEGAHSWEGDKEKVMTFSRFNLKAYEKLPSIAYTFHEVDAAELLTHSVPGARKFAKAIIAKKK